MSEDVPHYGPMTEQRAREILGDAIQADGLGSMGEYLAWPSSRGGSERAVLDGAFSADELEAIAWWMRNKASEPSPLELAFAQEPQRSIVDAALKKLGTGFGGK